jgi:hypothetical protein
MRDMTAVTIALPTMFYDVLRAYAAPRSEAADALDVAAPGASGIVKLVRCSESVGEELKLLAVRYCPPAVAIIASALRAA